MIKEIIGKLFPGWVTIYFTNSIDEYTMIRGKLIDNGIQTKTNSSNHSFGGRGHSGIPIPKNYEILVKKEEEYKARQIIHSSR